MAIVRSYDLEAYRQWWEESGWSRSEARDIVSYFQRNINGDWNDYLNPVAQSIDDLEVAGMRFDDTLDFLRNEVRGNNPSEYEENFGHAFRKYDSAGLSSRDWRSYSMLKKGYSDYEQRRWDDRRGGDRDPDRGGDRVPGHTALAGDGRKYNYDNYDYMLNEKNPPGQKGEKSRWDFINPANIWQGDSETRWYQEKGVKDFNQAKILGDALSYGTYTDEDILRTYNMMKYYGVENPAEAIKDISRTHSDQTYGPPRISLGKRVLGDIKKFHFAGIDVDDWDRATQKYSYEWRPKNKDKARYLDWGVYKPGTPKYEGGYDYGDDEPDQPGGQPGDARERYGGQPGEQNREAELKKDREELVKAFAVYRADSDYDKWNSALDKFGKKYGIFFAGETAWGGEFSVVSKRLAKALDISVNRVHELSETAYTNSISDPEDFLNLFKAQQRGHNLTKLTQDEIDQIVRTGKTIEEERDEQAGKQEERSDDLYEKRKDLEEKLLDYAEDEYREGKDVLKGVKDLEDDILEDLKDRRRDVDREYERDREEYEDFKKEREQRIKEYLEDRKSQIETEGEIDSLIKDVETAPSTVKEAVRQAEEESLRNQASLAASLPTRLGGSSARALLDQKREQDLAIGTASSVGQLQELEGRRNMISQLLGQKQGGQAARQQLSLEAGTQALEGGGQNLGLQELSLRRAGLEEQRAGIPLAIASGRRSEGQFGKQFGLSQIGLGLSASAQGFGFGQNAFQNYADVQLQNLQYMEHFRQMNKDQQDFVVGLIESTLGGIGSLGGLGFIKSGKK